MQWVTIVLMILKLLRQAKAADSQQEFESAALAANSPLAANGKILKWIWDNREEILAFIMTFFAAPAVFRAPPIPGTASIETASEEAEVLALVEELKG